MSKLLQVQVQNEDINSSQVSSSKVDFPDEVHSYAFESEYLVVLSLIL